MFSRFGKPENFRKVLKKEEEEEVQRDSKINWAITISHLEEEYRKQDDTKELYVQEKMHVTEEGNQVSLMRKGSEILKNLIRTTVEMITNKEKEKYCYLCGKPRHLKMNVGS